MKVYYLKHIRKIDGYDELKSLGIFSSKKEAEEAVEYYKKLPGFKDFLDGFCINEYEIDKDYWIEGF